MKKTGKITFPRLSKYIADHQPKHVPRFSKGGYRKDGAITNLLLQFATKKYASSLLSDGYCSICIFLCVPSKRIFLQILFIFLLIKIPLVDVKLSISVVSNFFNPVLNIISSLLILPNHFSVSNTVVKLPFSSPSYPPIYRRFCSTHPFNLLLNKNAFCIVGRIMAKSRLICLCSISAFV